jgi:energy-coupling factor transporter ATP-binding protein EcfA2
MRYAVLVTGPAGAGKSTFCASLITHLHTSKRSVHLVNLDPAAAPDSFEYAPSIDIKDLISVEDVMSEFGYGPNGGLVYCFEYVGAPFACSERARPSIFDGRVDTSRRIWTGSRRKSVNMKTTTLSLIAPVRLLSSCWTPTLFFFCHAVASLGPSVTAD